MVPRLKPGPSPWWPWLPGRPTADLKLHAMFQKGHYPEELGHHDRVSSAPTIPGRLLVGLKGPDSP